MFNDIVYCFSFIDNIDGNSSDDDDKKNRELSRDCDVKFGRNSNLYFKCKCGKKIYKKICVLVRQLGFCAKTRYINLVL